MFGALCLATLPLAAEASDFVIHDVSLRTDWLLSLLCFIAFLLLVIVGLLIMILSRMPRWTPPPPPPEPPLPPFGTPRTGIRPPPGG